MKIPVWKRWWSYIQDVPIEFLESDVNEEIHLLLSRGRFQLCSQNAIYSFDDLYTNFDEFFSKVNWSSWNPHNMLVLGFGLGSIPYLLEKKYQLELEVTGVELDPAIVYLASKYTMKRLKNQVEIIPTDALFFLQQNQIKYDAIAVDLFLDDIIPEPFMKNSFPELMQANLATNGLICFNHLYKTKKDQQKADKYFQTIFKPFFPEAIQLKVHKNCMMLNHAAFLNC